MKMACFVPAESIQNVFLILATSALVGSNDASALDAEALYENLSQHVVWIETTDELGRSSGQGSGLVLGPSLCTTNNKTWDRRYEKTNSEGIDILSNFHVVTFA